MPRQVRENQFPRSDEDELYPRESTEEKVSLSDRFGLRLAFYRISQNTYLQMVSHYAHKERLSISIKELQRIALEWKQRQAGDLGELSVNLSMIWRVDWDWKNREIKRFKCLTNLRE